METTQKSIALVLISVGLYFCVYARKGMEGNCVSSSWYRSYLSLQTGTHAKTPSPSRRGSHCLLFWLWSLGREVGQLPWKELHLLHHSAPHFPEAPIFFWKPATLPIHLFAWALTWVLGTGTFGGAMTNCHWTTWEYSFKRVPNIVLSDHCRVVQLLLIVVDCAVCSFYLKPICQGEAALWGGEPKTVWIQFLHKLTEV